MGGCSSVTMLAGHARAQGFVSHFAIRNSVAGMATETNLGFAELNFASNRLPPEIARASSPLVAGSEVKAWNCKDKS